MFNIKNIFFLSDMAQAEDHTDLINNHIIIYLNYK